MRIGNAASEQLQIDVFGEVMDALYQARVHGLRVREAPHGRCRGVSSTTSRRSGASRTRASGRFAANARHFVHSKVMAWVAFDRAVRVGRGACGSTGPSSAGARYATRSTPRCARRASTRSSARSSQSYGSKELDASLLMHPARRISAGLGPDGSRHDRRDRARRSSTTASCSAIARGTSDVDGLPPGEGVFLPCSFWLVDCLELLGRTTRRMRSSSASSRLANDVGLLAEEYDPRCEAPARQLPAGVHAPRARELARSMSLPHLPSPMRRRHAG